MEKAKARKHARRISEAVAAGHCAVHGHASWNPLGDHPRICSLKVCLASPLHCAIPAWYPSYTIRENELHRPHAGLLQAGCQTENFVTVGAMQEFSKAPLACRCDHPRQSMMSLVLLAGRQRISSAPRSLPPKPYPPLSNTLDVGFE